MTRCCKEFANLPALTAVREQAGVQVQIQFGTAVEVGKKACISDVRLDISCWILGVIIRLPLELEPVVGYVHGGRQFPLDLIVVKIVAHVSNERLPGAHPLERRNAFVQR